MPFVPQRPPSLTHLSDESASLALDKHLGNFVKAARELGADRKALRRLVWHNPNILNAAHERMWMFRSGVRSKILEAVWSRIAKRRRWGYDAMFDSYEFRDSQSAYAFVAPAPRQRAKVPEADNAQLVLEREATAELERERVAEFERELAFEMNGDRRPGPEGEETQADIEPTRALRAGSLSLDGCDADPVGEALVIAYEAPSPESAPQSGLPVWLGSYPAPPLVAHLYAPWTPPKVVPQPQPQPQPQRERGQEPRRRLRLSRGGWR